MHLKNFSSIIFTTCFSKSLNKQLSVDGPTLLQALSKRIHYGKFVAEAKFRAAPDVYTPAIIAQVSQCYVFYSRLRHFLVLLFLTSVQPILQDKAKLMDLLTYPEVEEAIKRRVEMKTRRYGQELSVNGHEDKAEPVYKINPCLVADLYGDWIMPLTKQVQVEYLLRRLD